MHVNYGIPVTSLQLINHYYHRLYASSLIYWSERRYECCMYLLVWNNEAKCWIYYELLQ
jgi:hypothetical protein